MAGTRLVIPQQVLKDYEAHKGTYGAIFDYFFDQYSVIGPALLDNREVSYHVPLVLEGDKRQNKIVENNKEKSYGLFQLNTLNSRP